MNRVAGSMTQGFSRAGWLGSFDHARHRHSVRIRVCAPHTLSCPVSHRSRCCSAFELTTDSEGNPCIKFTVPGTIKQQPCVVGLVAVVGVQSVCMAMLATNPAVCLEQKCLPLV